MPRKVIKFISFLLCFCFLFEQVGFAQVAGQLDISGHIAQLRTNLMAEKFRPLHLRYLSYDNQQNNFDLLLDKGDQKNLKSPQIEDTTKDLLRYFFVGISLPNESFWVNLRPDSQDQIIDPEVEKTDVGRILLEADLQLKKDTAKFTSPQTPEGKAYWEKLYEKAGKLFGSEAITIPTITRPWIVPDEVIIRETETNGYIYKATLKVMLEQDYLKNSSVYNFKDERLKALNEYASELIRQTIIPKLTQDINTAKRYAPLRQVYYSLILAQWFKARFYGKGGLYSYLIDKKNLTGLSSNTPWSKATYFKAYQKSFQEGEYNIKEPAYTTYGQTLRTYMSGGLVFNDILGRIAIPTAGTSQQFVNPDTGATVLRIGGQGAEKLVKGRSILGVQARPKVSSTIDVSDPFQGFEIIGVEDIQGLPEQGSSEKIITAGSPLQKTTLRTKKETVNQYRDVQTGSFRKTIGVLLLSASMLLFPALFSDYFLPKNNTVRKQVESITQKAADSNNRLKAYPVSKQLNPALEKRRISVAAYVKTELPSGAMRIYTDTIYRAEQYLNISGVTPQDLAIMTAIEYEGKVALAPKQPATVVKGKAREISPEKIVSPRGAVGPTQFTKIGFKDLMQFVEKHEKEGVTAQDKARFEFCKPYQKYLTIYRGNKKDFSKTVAEMASRKMKIQYPYAFYEIGGGIYSKNLLAVNYVIKNAKKTESFPIRVYGNAIYNAGIYNVLKAVRGDSGLMNGLPKETRMYIQLHEAVREQLLGFQETPVYTESSKSAGSPAKAADNVSFSLAKLLRKEIVSSALQKVKEIAVAIISSVKGFFLQFLRRSKEEAFSLDEEVTLENLENFLNGYYLKRAETEEITAKFQQMPKREADLKIRALAYSLQELKKTGLSIYNLEGLIVALAKHDGLLTFALAFIRLARQLPRDRFYANEVVDILKNLLKREDVKGDSLNLLDLLLSLDRRVYKKREHTASDIGRVLGFVLRTEDVGKTCRDLKGLIRQLERVKLKEGDHSRIGSILSGISETNAVKMVAENLVKDKARQVYSLAREMEKRKLPPWFIAGTITTMLKETVLGEHGMEPAFGQIAEAAFSLCRYLATNGTHHPYGVANFIEKIERDSNSYLYAVQMYKELQTSLKKNALPARYGKVIIRVLSSTQITDHTKVIDAFSRGDAAENIVALVRALEARGLKRYYIEGLIESILKTPAPDMLIRDLLDHDTFNPVVNFVENIAQGLSGNVMERIASFPGELLQRLNHRWATDNEYLISQVLASCFEMEAPYKKADYLSQKPRIEALVYLIKGLKESKFDGSDRARILPAFAKAEFDKEGMAAFLTLAARLYESSGDNWKILKILPEIAQSPRLKEIAESLADEEGVRTTIELLNLLDKFYEYSFTGESKKSFVSILVNFSGNHRQAFRHFCDLFNGLQQIGLNGDGLNSMANSLFQDPARIEVTVKALLDLLILLGERSVPPARTITVMYALMRLDAQRRQAAMDRLLGRDGFLEEVTGFADSLAAEKLLHMKDSETVILSGFLGSIEPAKTRVALFAMTGYLKQLGLEEGNVAMLAHKVFLSKDPLKCAQATVDLVKELISLGMDPRDEMVKVALLPFASEDQDPLELITPLIGLAKALKGVNASNNDMADFVSSIPKHEAKSEFILSCVGLITLMDEIDVYKRHSTKIIKGLLKQSSPKESMDAFSRLAEALRERKVGDPQAVTVLFGALSEGNEAQALAQELVRNKELLERVFGFVKELGSINLGVTDNTSTGVMMSAIGTDAIQSLLVRAFASGETERFADAILRITQVTKGHDSRLSLINSLAKSKTAHTDFIYSLGAQENAQFLKAFSEFLSKQRSPEFFLSSLLQYQDPDAISRSLMQIFSAFSQEEVSKQSVFIDKLMASILRLSKAKERLNVLTQPWMLNSWKNFVAALDFPEEIISDLLAGSLDEPLRRSGGDASECVQALLEQGGGNTENDFIIKLTDRYLTHVKFWTTGALSALKGYSQDLRLMFFKFLINHPDRFLINLEPILVSYNARYSGVSAGIRNAFSFFQNPVYLIAPILEGSLDKALVNIFKDSGENAQAFTLAVLGKDTLPAEFLSQVMQSYFSSDIPSFDQEILERIKSDSLLKLLFAQCLAENGHIFRAHVELFINTFNGAYGGCIKEVEGVFEALDDPRYLIAPIILGGANGVLNVIFKESKGDLHDFSARLLAEERIDLTVRSEHLKLYLSKAASWDAKVLNEVMMNDELIQILEKSCLDRPLSFEHNLAVLAQAFNPGLLPEIENIFALMDTYYFIPKGVIIGGLLHPGQRYRLQALLDLMIKENNATLLNEKRRFLERFFSQHQPLAAFDLIEGFLRENVNRTKRLEFFRGINGLLRTGSMTGEDTEEDWKLLLDRYIFSDPKTGKKKFGYLANRKLVLLHRALSRETPLDAPEMSAFKLDETGISETGDEGVGQLEQLIKKAIAKIIEERDIYEQLLDNPVIDGVIGGVTGFYTAAWGHGSNGGLKLKAFIENIHQLIAQGLIPPLDESYTHAYDLLNDGSGKKNEFFVHAKANIELSKDSRTTYAKAATLIREAALLSQKNPKELLEQIRALAKKNLTSKDLELWETLQDVSLDAKRRAGMEIQRQLCNKVLSAVEKETSLVGLSKTLVDALKVKVNGLKDIITLALLSEAFKNPDYQEKELVELANQNLREEFLRLVVELQNDQIKDHLLKGLNNKTKLALLSCLPFGAFEEELKRTEMLLKEGTYVKLFADNRVLGSFAPDIGDACYSSQRDFVTRTQPSKIVPIIFYTGEGMDVEFVGSMLILENKVEGKPVLILRAVNPNDEFLSRYSAKDFVNNAIKYAQQIAASKGVEIVVAPLGNVGSLSNRAEVHKAFPQFSQGKGLNLDEAENFNGYALQFGMVQQVVSASSSIDEEGAASSSLAQGAQPFFDHLSPTEFLTSVIARRNLYDDVLIRMLQEYIAHPPEAAEEVGRINVVRLHGLLSSLASGETRSRLGRLAVPIEAYLRLVRDIRQEKNIEIISYIPLEQITKVWHILMWFPKGMTQHIRIPIQLSFEELDDDIGGLAGQQTIRGVQINNKYDLSKHIIYHELGHKFSLSSNHQKEPLFPMKAWKAVARAAGFYGAFIPDGKSVTGYRLVALDALPDDLSKWRAINYGAWVYRDEDGGLSCYVGRKDYEKFRSDSRYANAGVSLKLYGYGEYWKTTPKESVAEAAADYIIDSQTSLRRGGRLSQAVRILQETLFVVQFPDGHYYRYKFGQDGKKTYARLSESELGSRASLYGYPLPLSPADIFAKFSANVRVKLQKIDLGAGQRSKVGVGEGAEGLLSSEIKKGAALVLKGPEGRQIFNTSLISKVEIVNEGTLRIYTQTSVYNVLLIQGASVLDQFSPGAQIRMQKAQVIQGQQSSVDAGAIRSGFLKGSIRRGLPVVLTDAQGIRMFNTSEVEKILIINGRTLRIYTQTSIYTVELLQRSAGSPVGASSGEASQENVFEHQEEKGRTAAEGYEAVLRWIREEKIPQGSSLTVEDLKNVHEKLGRIDLNELSREDQDAIAQGVAQGRFLSEQGVQSPGKFRESELLGLRKIDSTKPEEIERMLEELCSWLKIEESQLERSHNKEKVSALAAELHYLIGLIHPFNDRNGAVARLLVVYLVEKYGYKITGGAREEYDKNIQQDDSLLLPFGLSGRVDLRDASVEKMRLFGAPVHFSEFLVSNVEEGKNDATGSSVSVSSSLIAKSRDLIGNKEPLLPDLEKVGYVGQNEFSAGSRYLATSGLFTCVGVILYDPENKFGAIAHIDGDAADNAIIDKNLWAMLFHFRQDRQENPSGLKAYLIGNKTYMEDLLQGENIVADTIYKSLLGLGIQENNILVDMEGAYDFTKSDNFARSIVFDALTEEIRPLGVSIIENAWQHKTVEMPEELRESKKTLRDAVEGTGLEKGKLNAAGSSITSVDEAVAYLIAHPKVFTIPLNRGPATDERKQAWMQRLVLFEKEIGEYLKTIPLEFDSGGREELELVIKERLTNAYAAIATYDDQGLFQGAIPQEGIISLSFEDAKGPQPRLKIMVTDNGAGKKAADSDRKAQMSAEGLYPESIGVWMRYVEPLIINRMKAESGLRLPEETQAGPKEESDLTKATFSLARDRLVLKQELVVSTQETSEKPAQGRTLDLEPLVSPEKIVIPEFTAKNNDRLSAALGKAGSWISLVFFNESGQRVGFVDIELGSNRINFIYINPQFRSKGYLDDFLDVTLAQLKKGALSGHPETYATIYARNPLIVPAILRRDFKLDSFPTPSEESLRTKVIIDTRQRADKIPLYVLDEAQRKSVRELINDDPRDWGIFEIVDEDPLKDMKDKSLDDKAITIFAKYRLYFKDESSSESGSPVENKVYASLEDMVNLLGPAIVKRLQNTTLDKDDIATAGEFIQVVGKIYRLLDLTYSGYHNQAHNLGVTYGTLLLNSLKDPWQVKIAFLAGLLHDFEIRKVKAADNTLSAANVKETVSELDHLLLGNGYVKQDRDNAILGSETLKSELEESLRELSGFFKKFIPEGQRLRAVREIVAMIRRTDFSSDVKPPAFPSYQKQSREIRAGMEVMFKEKSPVQDVIDYVEKEYGKISLDASMKEEEKLVTRLWLDRQEGIEVDYLKALQKADMHDPWAFHEKALLLEIADQTSYYWLGKFPMVVHQVIENGLQKEKPELSAPGSYPFFFKSYILTEEVLDVLKRLPTEYRQNLFDNIVGFIGLTKNAAESMADGNALRSFWQGAVKEWEEKGRQEAMRKLGLEEVAAGQAKELSSGSPVLAQEKGPALTAEAILADPWVNVLLKRFGRQRESLQYLFQDFLEIEQAGDLRSKIFSEVDSLSDQDILTQADALLRGEGMQNSDTYERQTESKTLGRCLTLRELLLRPSAGLDDLGQLLFTNMTRVSVKQKIDNLPELSAIQAIRFCYTIHKALRILSQQRDLILVEHQDIEHLTEYLDPKNYKGYDPEVVNILKPFAANLFSLVDLFGQLETEGKKQSLENFISLIGSLQSNYEEWRTLLASKEYQSQIKALKELSARSGGSASSPAVPQESEAFLLEAFSPAAALSKGYYYRAPTDGEWEEIKDAGGILGWGKNSKKNFIPGNPQGEGVPRRILSYADNSGYSGIIYRIPAEGTPIIRNNWDMLNMIGEGPSLERWQPDPKSIFRTPAPVEVLIAVNSKTGEETWKKFDPADFSEENARQAFKDKKKHQDSLVRPLSAVPAQETQGKKEEVLSPTANASKPLGGIDMRAIPIITQPMSKAGLPVPHLPLPNFSFNLDEEWQQIQNMIDAGIIPSNERIKDYLQACCAKEEGSSQIEKILSCIADILRLEEDQLKPTEAPLRELLVLLESNKPVKDMQIALSQITVIEKEPVLIGE